MGKNGYDPGGTCQGERGTHQEAPHLLIRYSGPFLTFPPLQVPSTSPSCHPLSSPSSFPTSLQHSGQANSPDSRPLCSLNLKKHTCEVPRRTSGLPSCGVFALQPVLWLNDALPRRRASTGRYSTTRTLGQDQGQIWGWGRGANCSTSLRPHRGCLPHVTHVAAWRIHGIREIPFGES